MTFAKNDRAARWVSFLPLFALTGVVAVSLLLIHLLLTLAPEPTSGLTPLSAVGAPPAAMAQSGPASTGSRATFSPARRAERAEGESKRLPDASGPDTQPDAAAPADAERPRVDPRSKISPELLDQIDRYGGSDERISVILQTYVLWDRKGLQSTILEQRQASAPRELGVIGAWAVEMPVSEILSLAANGEVSRISSDARMSAFSNVTIPTTGTDQAWPSTANPGGVDGTGITVAVIDSGGRDDLIDLKAGNSKRMKKELDFTSGKSDGSGAHAEDNFGHATHVCGIVGGDGDKSASYTAHFLGVAPKVNLVSLKVLDDNGSGSVSNTINAIGWCVSNRAAYNIRVINLSLGHPVFESYQTDPLTLACGRAVDAGIVVVAAAGNQGWSNGHAVYGGIDSPGNAPWVITVGSLDTQGTVVRSDDDVSYYSSRGPTVIDGLMKPDLVAPGRRVVALLASPTCKIALDRPDLVVHGSDYGATGSAADEAAYLRLSGTSMASPVVSGAVALMLQMNPSLTPSSVKAILMYTAEKLARPSLLAQGAGSLNVEGAVRLAGQIVSNSDQVAIGASWLRNGPAAIRPTTTIGGTAFLWGSALIWGNRVVIGSNVSPNALIWGNAFVWSQAILWSQGTSAWDDPLIDRKQAGFAGGTTTAATDVGSRAILWANAILWSQSSITLSDQAILWSQSLYDQWNGSLVDPTSIGSSTALALPDDESASSASYVTGPPGAWYYPARPQ
jgi:serine protease AprX